MTPRELAYPGALGPGARGPGVRRLQEWLLHHGHDLVIDGVWGPATTGALRAYLEDAGQLLGPTLTLDAWEALSAPLHRATAPLRAPGHELGAALVAVARQHLAERPRELGGRNAGPWVRHYTGGPEVAWCAGAIRTWVRQACASLGVAAPGWTSLSVATMAREAARLGLEVSAAQVQPGDVFFWVRAGHGHTGLVVELQGGEQLVTIEGNTDPGGSREGDGVYARRRASAGLRFIRVG